MILEQQKQAEIMSLGTDNSIEMSIDMTDMKLLMEMFSRNIYSDAIGSTVRETVSNALDSSRRAVSNNPVIVTFKAKDTGGYEFTVEDFGLGLDDVEVRDIISKYMASTKRQSSTELGYYGVGFKSPLAYTSSFTFKCRKGGVERTYMMYEGEDINSIDLLNEAPTDENSGVKVVIPVKYGDRNDFMNKIREQLAYFDNVYFDVQIENPSYSYSRSEYTPKTIDNGFIIHRSEDFQWSELSADKSLHMCLDNVYYPIDFEKLGINRIEVPVALKFGLSDGIFPTINRESIRYTPEAKVTILSKLEKVANYFTEKYNESITDADDLQQVIDYYRQKERYITLEGKDFDIKGLITHSSIVEKEPKMKGVSILNLKRLSENISDLFSEYKVSFVYNNNRMSSTNDTLNYSNIKRFKFYRHSDSLKGNKKLYMRDVMSSGSRIIKKTKELKLEIGRSGWAANGYYQILKLEKYPKEQWRQVIKEFQYLRNTFINKMDDIDKIDVPQDWLDARKKKRTYTSVGGVKKLKSVGEVNCKIAESLLRYNDGNNCKFVSNKLKIEDLNKYKGFTIYTQYDGALNLDPLYGMSRHLNLRLLTFSSREMKIIEDLEVHNLIKYEEFMKGKNMPFRRIATSYVINELTDKYSSVFGSIDVIKFLSISLGDKLKTLYEYKTKYHKSGYSFNGEGYKAVAKVAEEYDLFDESIYYIYKEIKEFLESHYFINVISKELSRYNTKDKWTDVMRDMFKYHKIRMDYTNYKLNGTPLWIPEVKKEVNN